MSRASETRSRNRKARRALNRAGVVAMDRVVIDAAALAAGAFNGGNLVDLIAYQISEGLTRLDRDGADLVHGKTAITIGEHPDHPSALTIEIKADTLKREGGFDLGDIAIAPADESDLDDSDDGLLATP